MNAAQLVHAVRENDVAGLQSILAAGPKKPNQACLDQALCKAVDCLRPECVDILLRAGASPNAKLPGLVFGFEGKTVLLHAITNSVSCFSGVSEREMGGKIIQSLLNAGADANVKSNGSTPLLSASRCGDLQLVRKLIERGADPHVKSSLNGDSALTAARLAKKSDIEAYLKGLGVLDERTIGRTLANNLKKVYGGKLSEEQMGSPGHITTFLELPGRIEGITSRFLIGSDGFALTLLDLKHRDHHLRSAGKSKITFSSQPLLNDPAARIKAECLPGVGHTLSLNVYRTSDPGPISSETAIRICDEHGPLLRGLELADQEILEIGSSGIRLICCETKIERVQVRVRALVCLFHGLHRPPEPDRRLFESEWLIKAAPKRSAATASPNPPHRRGGAAPLGICANCGGVAHPMATFDLRDPRLGSLGLPFPELPAFWCLRCLDWGPSFFNLEVEIPMSWSKNAEAGGSVKDVEAAAVPERRLMLSEIPKGKLAGRTSKLGGLPRWIQAEETPDCPRCQRIMAFAFQLASHADCMFGDEGALYCFVCPECKVTATVIQSY